VDGKSYNEAYILKSPLFEMDKVKTPTIIFHGSEDRAVPRDQGWEYYRALQQIKKAPVKFLWFPGQPHGLRKITHQIRKMKEEIAWIEQYLLQKDVSKNEAFKKDSPLAAKLKLQKAAKSENLYGVMQDGVLLPEVVAVKADSISIAKFELTNAQYKSFKTDHRYEAGQDNHPVVLTKAAASDFVKWLSAKTNSTYRLANAAEAQKLHKLALKSAANGNTLNYWAGYSLVAADVAELKEKLSELSESLLEDVGSRQITKIGEAEVYGLGGNLAEHYEGGVYDLSAYDFYDQHSQGMVKSAKVGLRVIKE
ncbi:MAG: prolyl oligopeptidase family serine peptidase, partial [Bacteroidota bacterium]